MATINVDQTKAPAILTGSNPHRPSRYEAPYMYDGTQGRKDSILGWLRESINAGEWFLKQQSGYKFVDASRRIMADIGFDELPPTLSKLSDNFIKRQVRETVGLLANPRPIAAYKVENPEYDQQALILNGCYKSWYSESFVDRSLRAALQYAAVEGTGYLLMEWDPAYWNNGKSGVKLTPLGVDAVLPIQISPEDWDLDGAYATIVRRQVPVTEVIRRYPHLASEIVPDGDSVSGWRRLMNNMMEKVVPTVHNTYGSQRGYRGEDPAQLPLVTVYDIYVMDTTVNTSGKTMEMGVKDSPWAYRVPSYGEPIPVEGVNGPDGRPVMRPADYYDARIFPYKRHIVATRSTILYDGPSKWWHGKTPVVRFRLDDWPYEYCGIPITKEAAKMQAGMTSLLRAYDDSSNARLRPPISYDPSRISSTLARGIDPRSGGAIVAASDLVGPAFKLLIEPGYYQMSNDHLQFIQWLKEEGINLMGGHDLMSLQKAAQIPSADTIEKLEQIAGPLVTDLSRNMEASLLELGELFKAMVFEFYTAKRRFQILGKDGITAEDLDYDPGQLTPNTLAGETRQERARKHMNDFHFNIVPNSVYAITQSSRKLLTLQLARMGQPISPYTVLEQFDISNPGRPPLDAVTEIEKFKAWKIEEAELAIKIQQMAAQAQMEAQAEMQAANPLAQIAQLAQASLSGGGQGVGRPPSAQVQPHVEMKDGGARTTIAES